MVEEEELQIIERDIILTEGKQIYMEKNKENIQRSENIRQFCSILKK